MFTWIRQWWARYQLRRQIGGPGVHTVEGFGVFHIYPLTAPHRIMLQLTLTNEKVDQFDIYVHLVQTQVYEFAGRRDVGLRMDPKLIAKLGDAVLSELMMTSESQEAEVKKSGNTAS